MFNIVSATFLLGNMQKIVSKIWKSKNKHYLCSVLVE